MMRFILRLCVYISFFLFFSEVSKAQSFSFNCSRDTLVPGCPPGLCITLKGIIPDIKRLSNTYTLNRISPNATGCFPVYLAPNDPAGTPSGLTVDDTYTSVINMGFPFPFYGTVYNSLIASTNGFLSFDISKANLFAHWSIGSDLPSTAYDRALIMGPNHDLNPNVAQPTQRIQYQVWGVAPHRRWILSFYKVPLFGSSCTGLFENTHQIILYESTGIIEVNIMSKQTCTSWNSGRAIVGIQDFTKTQGMMAPGRTALGPTWGAVNMNETWRFVPSTGTSLLKRVELYDLGGTLIATGTTASVGNGNLEASFPNVCSPVGAITSYVIRSVYEKFDDPAVEIFGTDTVRVNRSAGLTGNGSSAAASCGSSNGSITITGVTGGTAPYEYSLNGVTWQSSNVFNGLTAGIYNVEVRDASLLCTRTIPVTVTLAGALPATSSSAASSCSGVNNGAITINTAGGIGPYTFTLDGGIAQPGVLPYTFNNVSPGVHTVIVTDLSSGCTSNPISVNVAVGTGVTANATSAATTCPTASNGSITITATAGTAPFTFQLDGGPVQSGASPYTFNNVSSGSHTIIITDNFGCTRSITQSVLAGPTLTATTSAAPTTCSGAANGTITVTPNGGVAPYTFSIDGAAAVPGTAPYTFTGLMTGSHTIVVTDGIGCVTNSINVSIPSGAALFTTASKTDALCSGSATGSIIVTQPTIGTAPFEYSLDGISWQGSNVFNGLAAGNYTVFYRESNGCVGSLSISVSEPTPLTASSAFVPVICNGQNNGIITISSGGGISPYEYSIDGGTVWQSNNIFNVAAGSYTITIRDANNCITTQTVSVTEPVALNATSANSPASCDGGNDGIIDVTATGGNTGYEYSIDGGTNWQSSNIFNVAPGNFTITVRDNLGCTTSFPTTVLLGSNFTMTPQTDPTICEGNSIQLSLTSNATQYAWTPANALSSTTIANPVANPTVTTQYIVTATLGRCSANDTVIVNVNPAPIPNAGADGYICFGQTYQLQATGGTQYLWSPDTYLSSTTISNPVSSATKDITYTVSILSDINGCASLVTDQIYIDVTPPIKVKTFPFDTIGYSGDQFQLLAIPNDPDVINYTWTPATGLSDTKIPDPIVTLGANGDVVQYRVTTSTIAGCKGEGFVTVRVYKGPEIYVATAFSPNGDGRNDRFLPIPVGIKGLNYFRVFNRWGQLLFSTNRLHDGWDGNLGGVKQPSGVYVWMIEVVANDNKVITKKGTVTLIR